MARSATTQDRPRDRLESNLNSLRPLFQTLIPSVPYSARTRSNSVGRSHSGKFLKVPTDVLNCENFKKLTTKSKALLLDLGANFNGFNNGDLAMPWSWMHDRCWKSKQTLKNARDELIAHGMIELTRQGGLNGASLYAFTWLPIEPCKGKLDVAPTSVASGKWKQPPANAEG